MRLASAIAQKVGIVLIKISLGQHNECFSSLGNALSQKPRERREWEWERGSSRLTANIIKLIMNKPSSSSSSSSKSSIFCIWKQLGNWNAVKNHPPPPPSSSTALPLPWPPLIKSFLKSQHRSSGFLTGPKCNLQWKESQKLRWIIQRIKMNFSAAESCFECPGKLRKSTRRKMRAQKIKSEKSALYFTRFFFVLFLEILFANGIDCGKCLFCIFLLCI